ncbi:MFS transporter [Novisyntrophococcus fermenticellae]|uniref:MFS transporter n=1 Tax=Novisyntrophococcus fermenticellae TaxID=2068655 RepID=UPI001E32F9E8|nr:MFS transporter [Novisyntrophococcus fermenticellae]
MENRSKVKNMLLMLTLFLTTTSIMGDCVVAVVTSKLYAQYDAWAVNLMISGPCIAGLIACPIAGRLCDKMDKKAILIVGYVLYAISSIGGAAVDNQVYMIVMRFIATGISYGLTSTAALGIVADCYADEDQRSKVVGWYNAAMAILGGVLGLAAGALAVNNWRNTFAVNWFAIPVIILVVIFIPACPPVRKSYETAQEKVKGNKGWYKRLIPLLGAFLVVGFCYYTIITMMDLYVADNALGNSAFTGLLGTVGTIGSCIACSVFGFTYGKLKNRCSIISYIILAAGFLLMAGYPSVQLALVCCALMGAAWGNVYSFWWMRCTVVVPEDMVGTSIGITGTINSISGFACPYALLFFKNLLKTDNVANTFYIYGMIIAIAAVLSIVINIKNKNEEAAE